MHACMCVTVCMHAYMNVPVRKKKITKRKTPFSAVKMEYSMLSGRSLKFNQILR